jgi:hypothetical protein
VIERAAREVSVNIYDEADIFVNECSRLLWDCASVRQSLLRDEKSMKAEYRAAATALFLRFARPLAECVVRYPVGSVARRSAAARNGHDLGIIDNYQDHKKTDPALWKLRLYVEKGPALLVNAALRTATLGNNATPFGGFSIGPINPRLNGSDPAPAETNEQVIAEVEADLNVLEHLLASAVFSAGGFGPYRDHELARLRDQFSKVKADQWRVEVNRAMVDGKENLLRDLPDHLRAPVNNVEVSRRLRELRLALDGSPRI